MTLKINLQLATSYIILTTQLAANQNQQKQFARQFINKISTHSVHFKPLSESSEQSPQPVSYEQKQSIDDSYNNSVLYARLSDNCPRSTHPLSDSQRHSTYYNTLFNITYNQHHKTASLTQSLANQANNA